MNLIRTPRLLLRTWEAGDARDFWELNQDPRVTEFLPGPLTMAQAQAFITLQQDLYARSGACYFALTLASSGELAGFVLLDRESHSGLPTDFNMGEFFVARHYRREGVGREAALLAIQARPGQWELAVARRNTGALAFWRRIAAAAASEVEELDRHDPRWNGAILRFRAT